MIILVPIILMNLLGLGPAGASPVSQKVDSQGATRAQDNGPAPAINGSMSAEQLSTALDWYLAARTAAGEFAGVVLVAREGKVLFERGYGPADRKRNTPMQSTLRFNVASIGKGFTKVAVGQLVAQGKLALTDTIAMRLPDHPNKEAL